MSSLKKGVICLILFFIVIWMFVLGIFVGRGSAPVKFDTRKFQKKLATIAGQYKAENKNLETTDVQFYEALKMPMPGADMIIDNQKTAPPEFSESKETEYNADTNNQIGPEGKIVLKLSRKSLTKGKYSSQGKNRSKVELSSSVKPVPGQKKVLDKKVLDKEVSKKSVKDKFTIQIAAYKDVKGAVDRISSLKTKGYTGYKTLGKVQDQIWHRVRVGHFSDTEVARRYLRRLKSDNINGIIIKQDL